MISGMDTESIVSQLVQAKSVKVDKLKSDKQKIEWKQETWKELNSKMYSFYSKTLDNMRTKGAYNKMKASIVDSSIASVSANNSAVTGTQTLAVKQLAKSGYVTGGEIKNSKASTGGYSIVALDGVGDKLGSGVDIKVNIGDDKEETITLTSAMTLDDVAKAFTEKGLNSNYDATNQRFFISSKESGKDANFNISSDSAEGQAVLDALGLSAAGKSTITDSNGVEYKVVKAEDGTYNAKDADGNDLFATGAKSIEELIKSRSDLTLNTSAGGWSKIEGQDAVIELNGAEFSSKSNSFSINGLSITAQSVSAKDANNQYVTTNVSTDKDVDEIYNMIKDFFKEYNELIKEMDTKYNADSAKDYDVLTDDEKEAMSEDEIEKWNNKIKDSLLRRDESLGANINMFKDAMAQSFTVNGTNYSLSSFGINTLSYFLAGDNEKGVFHIDGDPDDTNTKGEKDKLKAFIGANLEDVTDFFYELSDNLYQKITAATKHSDYRSVYSMYDDKTLQKEYDDMESNISDEEEKLADLEDKYYDKFSAMETALAKLQEKQNALGQLLGS